MGIRKYRDRSRGTKDKDFTIKDESSYVLVINRKSISLYGKKKTLRLGVRRHSLIRKGILGYPKSVSYSLCEECHVTLMNKVTQRRRYQTLKSFPTQERVR